MRIRPPWQFEDPLCSQVGGTFFFTKDRDEDDTQGDTDYSVAKTICMKCEHRVECAIWALKYEEFGYWGGLSPNDRKRIRAGHKEFPYKKAIRG